MRKSKNISGKILPCVLVENRISLLTHQLNQRPDIGLLHSFSRPDYIEVTRNGGTRQSNLFPVSTGSDLRMSTCDLILISSAGVEKRRSGTAKAGRGFLRFSSRSK